MTETRWLDPLEMRIWRGFLEASLRVDRRLDVSLKEAAGLTLEDYEVLVALSESEGRRLRMSELSAWLLHSQSRLSHRIDRLEQRGLVRREKCPNDGRGLLAVLTDDGFAELTAAAPGHLGDVRAALIDLIEPAEREVVANVLERIVAANRDPDDQTGSGQAARS